MSSDRISTFATTTALRAAPYRVNEHGNPNRQYGSKRNKANDVRDQRITSS